MRKINFIFIFLLGCCQVTTFKITSKEVVTKGFVDRYYLIGPKHRVEVLKKTYQEKRIGDVYSDGWSKQ